MNTILALDPGRFKSVACFYDACTMAALFDQSRSSRTGIQDLRGQASDLRGQAYEIFEARQVSVGRSVVVPLFLSRLRWARP
jgi:hypothetical protein